MAEIAYIMGLDPPGGGNKFYANAAGYFAQIKAVVFKPPTTGPEFTLQDVLTDLDARAKKTPAQIFDTIHVVTHANAFGGVQFGIDSAHQLFYGLAYTNVELLTEAHASVGKPGSLFVKPLSSPAVTDKTTIQIDGCDIGRDEKFLKLFGLMFGRPKRVLGSKRVVMFMHIGTKFRMMPCRSWTIVHKPAVFPPKNNAQWTAFRTEFVSKAALKFSSKAMEVDPLGFDTIERTLTTAATGATLATRTPGGFFFTETMDYTHEFIPPPADDLVAFTKIIPPSRSSFSTGSAIDDTTVLTTITAADFKPLTARTFTDAGKQVREIKGTAMMIALAETLGVDSDTSNRDHYAEVLIGPEKAPSPGPKPSP